MSANSKDLIDDKDNLSMLYTNAPFDQNPSDKNLINILPLFNDDFSLDKLKYIDKKSPKNNTRENSIGTEIITEKTFEEVFSKKESNHMEPNENQEETYLIIDRNIKHELKKNKKNLFLTEKNKQKRPPGRKGKEFLHRKRKHGKEDLDNILSKIQIHYINFIRNLSNDAIKTVPELNPKEDIEFKDIDYRFKRCINFSNFEKLKNLPIKDILCKPISPKFTKFKKKCEQYNLFTYNKVIKKSEWLKKCFEIKYNTLFERYYNNSEQLNNINLEGKIITLSNKTKSFYDLINSQKNEDLKQKIIDVTELAYLNKKRNSNSHSLNHYFDINKRTGIE